MLTRLNPLFYLWACLAVFFLSSCAVSPPRQELPAATPTQVAATPVPTPEEKPITLVAGGDVLPACFLDPYIHKYGQDYPYQKIAPIFQAADIGLVNLECPLSNRGKRYRKKKYTFRAQPEAVGAMKKAGITAVSLANNHMMDYGPLALKDTLDALRNTGIAYAGAGKNRAAARAPACIETAGNTKIALLSYTLTYPAQFWATGKHPGTSLARLPYLEADIASATAWADWVVVCFHWGGELLNYPKAYQTMYAHASIDYGADLVVGTHPHVLQGIEWYKNRLILYSLGNFVFGGGRSRKAVDSALIKVQFFTTGEKLKAWVMPLNVNNLATAFVPEPMPGEQGKAIFQLLETFSRAWGTTMVVGEDGWGELKAPPEVLGPPLPSGYKEQRQDATPDKEY